MKKQNVVKTMVDEDLNVSDKYFAKFSKGMFFTILSKPEFLNVTIPPIPILKPKEIIVEACS